MARVTCSPAAWQDVRYERVVDDAADLGYHGVEISRAAMEALYRDRSRLRGLLEARNLTLTAAPLVGHFFERSERAAEVAALQRVADFLAEINEGATVLFRTPAHPARRDMIAGVPPLLPLDSDRVARVADTLNELCDRCGAFGLRGTVMNRVGTYLETPDEYIDVIERTDPEVVGLAPDFGHWAYAGGDVDLLVRDYRDRISFPRVKDLDGAVLERVVENRAGFRQFVRSGGFTAPGQGSLPLESALLRLEKAEYRGWVSVELEPGVAEPREWAESSRAYLRDRLHW